MDGTKNFYEVLFRLISPSMIMKQIFFISIAVVLGCAMDLSSTPDRRMQVINLSELYPRGVASVQTRKKYILEYGCPTDEILQRLDDIESRPVEERLVKTRQGLFSDATRLCTEDPDFSSQFIDVRIMRLLIRIAVNRREPDEVGITSACDVLDFVRLKYPQVDFNCVTPRLILDWYQMIGQQTFCLRGHRDIVFGPLNTSDPRRMHISKAAWHRFILEPRLERLAVTGYDA